MLHAFNRKNVRRVLASSGYEHSNEKNEDAITSMVFSPLSFMPPGSALEVLIILIGNRLGSAVNGRIPLRHELQLWPSGLSAPSWDSDCPSRCEPDFVARFDFGHDLPILVIGEMKWDWQTTADHLAIETARQRKALSEIHRDATQIVFTVTKFALATTIKDTTQLTWTAVHRAATILAQRMPDTPEGRWGELVGTFLMRAEQVAFQGFRSSDFERVAATRPIFWNTNHD